MPSKYKPDSIIISIIILLLAFFIMQSMQHVSGFIGDLWPSSYSSSFSSSLLIGQVANALDGRDIRLSSMNNANGSLTIVTVSNNGSFLPGAAYSISSYPATSSSGNFTIRDDGPEDTNRATRGIISISRLHEGNYMVTELKAPEGYVVDKLSKVIQISGNQSSAGATFTNNNALNQIQQNNNSQIKSITYTAKFECGSIIGNEGPLRPGHYDTDISIFNRQEYSINILLNVIVNGGANTNAIVKTIQPQTSTGVVCKDIRQFLGMGNNSKELIEGFVIIRLDVNGGILSSLPTTGGGTVISSSPVTVDDINDFLDVQVFYTANALEFLPREILVKEIGFAILNDTSSKIPKSLLMKPLDITVQSQMNEIFDPESKIRGILSGRYNLSDNELAGLRIKIINMSIGVAAMIDDHAISSSIVRPQASA
jgi:hypothetical protein